MAENFLKKNLRVKLRREHHALPPAVRRRNDHIICTVLANDSQLSAFSQIFLYAAINAEPDLTALAEQWCETKQLALPVVDGNRLIFCRWQPRDELVRGEFNVPTPTTRQVLTADQDTLVLLPCVALDRYGNRLGYGGGYYDRCLGAHPTGCTVGVCYHRFFLETELPTRPHDCGVNYIVTEQGLHAAASC